MTVFRVDKFVVPDHSLEEFMVEITRTHSLISAEDGVLQNSVLVADRESPSVFNVVTLVEWESHDFLDAARKAIRRVHEQRGFDRRAFMTRLGVTADTGTYLPA